MRGAKVIAFARDVLDQAAPLAEGSHKDSAGYAVVDGQLQVTLQGGATTGLKDPAKFVGYRGEPAQDASQPQVYAVGFCCVATCSFGGKGGWWGGCATLGFFFAFLQSFPKIRFLILAKFCRFFVAFVLGFRGPYPTEDGMCLALAAPNSVLLKNNGNHIDIVINKATPIGQSDPAGVADLILEAALSTILDLEDSVAAVDAADKVVGYRHWLGILKGTLKATFEKGTKTVSRGLSSGQPWMWLCPHSAPEKLFLFGRTNACSESCREEELFGPWYSHFSKHQMTPCLVHTFYHFSVVGDGGVGGWVGSAFCTNAFGCAMGPCSHPDRLYTTPGGQGELRLHGRALLFLRNVGHLMTNPAILWGPEQKEIPEGVLEQAFF